MSILYDKRSFRSFESVGAYIGRVRKALIEKLDQELVALGLNTAQSLVIVMLAEEVASTASEMCRGLSHDPGAMTRLVDKLELKGRALYPRIAEMQVNVFNRMLQGFNRSEVGELEGFLKRMLANA